MQKKSLVFWYNDRAFKNEQNDVNFEMKLIYQIGVNLNFIYQVNDAQTTQKNEYRHYV